MRASARRAAAALFPGARAIWLGALVVFLVGAVVLARVLTADVGAYTGTNSVDVATVVAEAGDGQRVCVRDLVVPRETGRVELWLATLSARPGGRVDAWIAAAGRRIPLERKDLPSTHDFHPFSAAEPIEQDLHDAAVCVVPRRAVLAFGGASVMRLPDAPVTTVAGEPLVGSDIGVRFLRPFGDSPSTLEAFAEVRDRANVFEPGLGTALFWLVPPGFVLLLYFVTRVAATAQSRSLRRLAATAAVVTFGYAAAWAVLLHPFHGADESEHFAYAQHVAVENERPDPGRDSTRPPYSSSQYRLMEALHHTSTILNGSSRIRWDGSWERRYRAASRNAADDDGGGFTESATGHSPLYYFVAGLPYRVLGDPEDLTPALLAMRLLNAALAALVAALAVLTAGALFGPRARPVAWLAGVLAGLQPVFGSVAASVNNDTAVNVAGAALLFALVSAWARGPSLRNAVAVGALAIAVPVAKVSGFALLPVIAVALVPVALRHGIRPSARWAGAAALSALAAAAIWMFALSPLIGGERGEIRYVHPDAIPAPGVAPAVVEQGVTNEVRVEYFVQTFVPWLGLGTDHWEIPGSGPLERWPAYAIYINRGYGMFGWKTASISQGLKRGIFLALLAGWILAAVAAFRHRRLWRRWLGGVAILAIAVLGVLAAVAYANATTAVRTDFGEQGRYIFPALVPLAVLLSGSVLAFRGRLRDGALGVAVAAASLLAVIAWTHAMRGWFV